MRIPITTDRLYNKPNNLSILVTHLRILVKYISPNSNVSPTLTMQFTIVFGNLIDYKVYIGIQFPCNTLHLT